MRIYHARRNRCAGRKPELVRRGVGKSADPRTRSDDIRADPDEAFLCQLAQPDRFEIARVPAILMSEVCPLARHRAGRTGQAARCPPAQEVGKIEKLPGLPEDVRTVLAEPKELGRLHLR